MRVVQGGTAIRNVPAVPTSRLKAELRRRVGTARARRVAPSSSLRTVGTSRYLGLPPARPEAAMPRFARAAPQERRAAVAPRSSAAGSFPQETHLPTNPPRALDSLLAHREWVRTLARALTRDTSDADDVEQQTWLAALLSGPPDARSPRAWLTTVATNAARKLRRTDARQLARAVRRPTPDTPASAAELAEEAETHARVAAAVVALDEPYREAVLLRYFEGLPVPDAAARSGCALETMRSRLRRARGMLRDRLEREFPESRSWRIALVALATRGDVRPESGAAVVSAGGLLMGTKLVAGAVVVLAAISVALVLSRDPHADVGAAAPTPPGTPSPAARASASPTRAAQARAERPAAAAEPLAPASAVPLTPAPVAPTAMSARERIRRRLDAVDPLLLQLEFGDDTGLAAFGRIADATDCPVVLTQAAADALAKSPLPTGLVFSGRIDGERLLLTVPPIAGLTAVIEDARVVVAVQGETVGTSTVVVEPPRPARRPAAAVRGVVRDAKGTAASGASIVLFDGIETVVATSGADGSFSFERRGLGAHTLHYLFARDAALVASPAVRLTVPVPTAPVEFALGEAAGSLRVRVVSDTGPVSGAFVAIGSEEAVQRSSGAGPGGWDLPRRTRTDDDGTCTFASVAAGPVTVRVGAKGLVAGTGTTSVDAGRETIVEIRLGAAQSVTSKLASTRVSARFRDTRLRDVVSFLSRVSRVNLITMPDVGDKADTPVSIDLADEPLEGALRTLCGQVPGVTYEVRDADGVVILRLRRDGE